MHGTYKVRTHGQACTHACKHYVHVSCNEEVQECVTAKHANVCALHAHFINQSPRKGDTRKAFVHIVNRKYSLKHDHSTDVLP